MIFFQFQDILPLLLWKECKFRMILSENELRFFYQIFFLQYLGVPPCLLLIHLK